jgi:protein AATF/BFR2
LTLRITFQKALSSSSSLPTALPDDAAGEVEEKKQATLKSLGELSERLFTLRETLALPGTEKIGGKRKRDGDFSGTYWQDAASDAFSMTDA